MARDGAHVRARERKDETGGWGVGHKGNGMGARAMERLVRKWVVRCMFMIQPTTRNLDAHPKLIAFTMQRRECHVTQREGV
ncbi:MAG: hypothetical protein ACRDF4_06820 [Rhabdochlamydiaceae bacterium]